MTRSFLAVILLTVLAAGNLFAQSQEALQYVNEEGLSLSSAQSQVLSKAKEEKALASYKLFRFNNLASLKEQTSFNISLPGKASLTVERKRFKANKTNEWTMSGTLDGENGSIFLSATDGDVTGVIHTDQELYWLQPIGDGLHILIKVDPKKIPLDEPKDWNPASPDTVNYQPKSEKETSAEESSLEKTTAVSAIDILVAYTPAVAQHSGNITSLVNACIQSTNDGFANSNMTSNVQAALAHAVQVSYTESGNVITDNNRLLATSDGYMDNIFSLRDQYHADIVVLLVDFDNGGLAGYASGIEVSASSAYAVAVDNYAVGNYTFAHEIGHLVGARHDNDPNNSPRAYAHGYRYNPAYWRTVMAVYDPNVLRINYWSSPVNTYGGVPMGTSNWNDDRRVWNERASTVAAFRSYAPLVVTISGPSSLAFKQVGNYTANVTGGSGQRTYQWYRSSNGGSTWTAMGTSQNQTYTMTTYDIDLKCTVHDTQTGEYAYSPIKHVTYFDGTPKVAAFSNIPKEYSLSNYPNPFNPLTIINYQLPNDGFVSIKVYDALGREIKNLVTEFKIAGSYDISFNAADLPSGIYLTNIIVNNANGARSFSLTKKMLLLK